jgi:hypothetical protein
MNEELKKLYEAKKMFEELGIALTQNQQEAIMTAENAYLETHLFPKLKDFLVDNTKDIQGEVHIAIHKDGQGNVEIEHIDIHVKNNSSTRKKTTSVSKERVIPKIKRGKEEITFADDTKYIPTVKELVDLVKSAAASGDKEKINGGVAMAIAFNVTYDNSKVTPANGGKKYNRRTVICSDEEIRLDGIYRRALGCNSFSEWLTGAKRGYNFK